MLIERDNSGFVTDQQTEVMYENLPIVVRSKDSDWELITKQSWLYWQAELQKVDYVEWGRVHFVSIDAVLASALF